jgi:fucose permease
MSAVSKGRLIPAAILAIFVYGMIAAMLGTLLPSFKLTPQQNSFLALLQAIGLAVASVTAGPLIDNKGKKTGMVLSLVIITVSVFALPNVSGYQAIMLCLLGLGFGGGCLVTAANTLVSDISADRRATVLNLLNLFFGLGLMATPFISGHLLGRDVFKLCYLVAGLTAAVLLLNVFTAMPKPSGERGFKISELNQLLSRPSLYLLGLMLFLYVACEVGFTTWLPKYLTGQGVSETTALNALSGFAFGILIGRVVVSPILIKISAPTVTLIAAMLMTVTTFVTLRTLDTTLLGAAVFCAGLAMAPVFPTTLAMVGGAFPKATATAMGFVITSGWIGFAASSPIIGAIAGDDPKRLQTALLLFPAAAILMIIVNLVLRPMLKAHHEAGT